MSSPAVVAQIVIQGINMGLLYALAALAISLIWNASGLFNFSQGDMLSFGGYMMLTFYSVRRLGLPYIPSFILTVAILALGGFLISKVYFYPMFRQNISPNIILIGTVALAVFLRNYMLLTWGPDAQNYPSPFGTEAIHIGPIIIMAHFIWNIVIVIALVIALQFFLRGTVIGIAMRAVAQRPVAASLMGVKVGQMISLTFMLSTILAAISGILIAPIIPLTPEMGGRLAVKAFAAVLIGGLGSFAGAMVGGLLVGVAEVIFSTVLSSTYKDVFIFIVLIVFLLIRPGGIFRADISDKV